MARERLTIATHTHTHTQTQAHKNIQINKVCDKQKSNCRQPATHRWWPPPSLLRPRTHWAASSSAPSQPQGRGQWSVTGIPPAGWPPGTAHPPAPVPCRCTAVPSCCSPSTPPSPSLQPSEWGWRQQVNTHSRGMQVSVSSYFHANYPPPHPISKGPPYFSKTTPFFF